MTIQGNTQQWHDLLDSFVPDIVNLILAAWESMPPIANDSKEDPVSIELCKKLRTAKTLADLPLQVHTQTVELDSQAENVEQGRIDITFHPMVPSEAIYFALECKRVNVMQANGKVRRYFAEYVTEGLTRFVSGQYSHSVRQGGMIAFVLDGDVPSAINGVLRNIVDKRILIRLIDESVKPSRFLPANESMRETTHSRDTNAGDVLIQHFFLCVNPADLAASGT